MRRIILILLAFSNVLFPQNIPEEITQTLTNTLLQKREIPDIHLNDQTYVSYDLTNDYFGKNQLKFMFKEFLQNHKFHTVKVSNSHFGERFSYIFFVLTNGRQKYHIYFSVNIKDKLWQIDQITIKEFN